MDKLMRKLILLATVLPLLAHASSGPSVPVPLYTVPFGPAVVVTPPAPIAKVAAYIFASPSGEPATAPFAAYLGRQTEMVGAGFDYTAGWSGMVGSATYEATQWSAAGYRIEAGLPLMTVNNTTNYTQLQCITTPFPCDTYFTQIGQALVAHGQANAILRVGWEANGQTWPWAPGYQTGVSGYSNDVPGDTSFAHYIALYQRAVTALKAVPGNSFLFDWNMNFGNPFGQTNTNPLGDAVNLWPGGSYVDIIGDDFYNVNPDNSGMSASARWNNYLTQPRGLNWFVAYAASQGKPTSFPEWATGYAGAINTGVTPNYNPSAPATNTAGSVVSGGTDGDDAYWVQHVAAFMAANNFAYHGYWNNYQPPQYGGELPPDPTLTAPGIRFPLVSAEYTADFGGTRTDLGTAPGPVTGFSMTSHTSSQIVLQWTLPTSGGTPAQIILGRRVTGSGAIYNNNPGVFISGTTATVTITGLSGATSYDFQVRTSNQAGNSSIVSGTFGTL